MTICFIINLKIEISKFIDNPKFFIFSDDIAWVKDNLKIKDASYIDNNKGTPAACQHGKMQKTAGVGGQAGRMLV